MASDIDILAKLSAELEGEHRAARPNIWRGSPFEWLRSEPPARKGAIGKEIFKRWAGSVGYVVSAAPPRSQCDCVVDGLKVIIKFGLLWGNGRFVFEQIRRQDYAAGILLGLEPCCVHLWVVPQDVLWEVSKPQHGPDTHWLHLDPSRPPEELAAFGGTLAVAQAALSEQAGRVAGD